MNEASGGLLGQFRTKPGAGPDRDRKPIVAGLTAGPDNVVVFLDPHDAGGRKVIQRRPLSWNQPLVVSASLTHDADPAAQAYISPDLLYLPIRQGRTSRACQTAVVNQIGQVVVIYDLETHTV